MQSIALILMTVVLSSGHKSSSDWPAQGGPVVIDDTVYFAAGIWPSEGVYIYAVSADTGRVIWCNDSSGSLEMDQPHGTARARSGVAAQGYQRLQTDCGLTAN
jgi:outer membrane protein assembly factor BamB